MRPLPPAAIATTLSAWLAARPPDWGDADPATARFCDERLRHMACPQALADKLAADLGTRLWRPLGRVLIVVSENDVLGTVAAFVAALLTGNAMRIKARHSLAWLESLKAAFALDDAACTLADWHSATQDDARVLADVDGVVLAGSAQLIAHYRRVAPPHLRLVEYGPRLSGVAVWPQTGEEAAMDEDTDIAALTRALLHDTALFAQNVCSSPQFIVVDAAIAPSLFARLQAALPHLPPLPEALRALQGAKAHELRLLAQLHPADPPLQCHVDPSTGWGVTLAHSTDAALWLPRGFRLIAGEVGTHLAALCQRHRHHLQTLGEWPPAALAQPLPVGADGFFHRCLAGQMHQRPFTAPHDGQIELAQWVHFVSHSGACPA